MDENPGDTVTNVGFIGLIAEIIKDAQTLILQEIRLAKHEFHAQIRKTITATVSVAAGIGIAAIGGLLLILMLVYGLETLTDLPLWACYGMVGATMVSLGALLLFLGTRQFKKIRVVPVRTMETLRENMEWFKEIATSSKM